MAKTDSVVLPLRIAAERTALSEQELVAHPYVSVFTRILPEREDELAVVDHNVMLVQDEPLPMSDELDAL